MADEDFGPAGAWPRQAGLWRRLWAFIIDYLVIFVVLYSLVAALFLLTDGGVKGSFGLNWKICQPATLTGMGDPSLARYDWQLCSTSIFGLPVARWAAGTSTDAQTKLVSTLSLDLDANGKFRPAALDLGFLQALVLAAYLLIMEAAFGRSLGKGVLGLAVHDEFNFHREGLPWRKATRRQMLKFAGYGPAILAGAYFAFRVWKTAPMAGLHYSRLETAIAFIATVIAFIWPCWIALNTATSGEPIHDRLAGTTVRVEREIVP